MKHWTEEVWKNVRDMVDEMNDTYYRIREVFPNVDPEEFYNEYLAAFDREANGWLTDTLDEYYAEDVEEEND